LESTWFNRTAYAKTFGTNLKSVVARHADSIRQFPDSAFAKALPTLFANPGARLTMREFDQIVSIHCAGCSPPFPFSDEWAYYAHASSHDKLDTIRIPFLALHSDDDPIVSWLPENTIAAAGSPSSSLAAADTWVGSSPAGLRIAGLGGLRSSGSGRQPRMSPWDPDQRDLWSP